MAYYIITNNNRITNISLRNKFESNLNLIQCKMVAHNFVGIIKLIGFQPKGLFIGPVLIQLVLDRLHCMKISCHITQKSVEFLL